MALRTEPEFDVLERRPAGGTELHNDRPITPVKWWAAGGVLLLGLIVFSVGRWLLGGHATQTPAGPSKLPTSMFVSIWIMQIACPVMAVVFFYRCIIRPWRRERRLTTDGVLFLAYLTLWITDPWANYFRISYVYNAHAFNLGCPQCFIPGWQSTQRFAEPFVLGQTFYWGWLVFVTLLGCKLLGWYRNRWPHRSRLNAFGFILSAMLVLDFVTEVLWLRTGIYTYPNQPLALFSSHYYRFPLHMWFFAAMWYTGLICCRYFVNDKGETWATRGLSQMRISQRRRTGLAILASIAMYNASLVLTYMVPVGLVAAVIPDAWPKDVYSRSYFSLPICGPHSESKVACVDPRVPMPVGPASAYVTTDGKLIAPKGLPHQSLK